MRTGCLGLLAVIAVCLGGLFFAGSFYTAERRWVPGVRLGDSVREHPPLRSALQACVATDDPAALAAYHLTGSYRTSGWFLREPPWSAVARCMRLKGWLLMPARIYSL